jgi:hypothetical protein
VHHLCGRVFRPPSQFTARNYPTNSPLTVIVTFPVVALSTDPTVDTTFRVLLCFDRVDIFVQTAQTPELRIHRFEQR